MERIRLLIINASTESSNLLQSILKKDFLIHIVGIVNNLYDARKKIGELKPDVLTLDIQTPDRGELHFLKILMETSPMPVLVVTSQEERSSRTINQAFELGAVDVIYKPLPPFSENLENLELSLINKVRAASLSKISALASVAHKTNQLANEQIDSVISSQNITFHPKQILLLGASTGGTDALRSILTSLPPNIPPICVVLHIPSYFSKAFALRLNECCKFKVKEAEDGEELTQGVAFIAPGDYHMRVLFNHKYHIKLSKDPKVWYQRPAVDVLFKSAAKSAGKYAVAAILTGMGKDGAEGLSALKKQGARTFAQDQQSSASYGMPQAALDVGAAEQIVPLSTMPSVLYNTLCSLSPKLQTTKIT
ncbi:MAG: hypothetical protein A2007_05385 [Verrucomicrobia bacterium GWC2_42_7]|nr:MAG: hypothetical protein A2007_05385 [Verrucomicrobia bacterium GWC2_42_7]